MPHPMIITAISSPFIAFTSFLLLGLLFLWFPVFLWLSCFLFPASLLLGVKMAGRFLSSLPDMGSLL